MDMIMMMIVFHSTNTLDFILTWKNLKKRVENCISHIQMIVMEQNLGILDDLWDVFAST